MMIRAYNEIYLDSAMQTLAETFSFVSNSKDADLLFERFIMSGIASQFGRGNPKYINMPSHVLFDEISNGYLTRCKPNSFERTPEYWCGFVLAYYQWYTGLSFEEIGNKISTSKIISLYNPFHEVGLDKFVEFANTLVLDKETNLAKYRKMMNLSQKKLAKYSGVSLRSIQLYEQRHLDINVAPAEKLYKLAKVLGCNIENLLEMMTGR